MTNAPQARTKLLAMQIAAAAHNEAMDGFSGLTNHFDPKTGDFVESGSGIIERTIAEMIHENFDNFGDEPAEAIRTIVKDLEDMASELSAVASALGAASPDEEEPEEDGES